MELPRVSLPGRATSGGGAPFALPTALDHASERWWRLSPRVRTVVVLVLVVVALAMVGRGATTSRWGPPVAVLVAASDLPAGTPLGPGDVRATTWPQALVPADALPADAGSADLPADARLRGPVRAGALLTRGHLASGLAGMLTVGEAAVSIPLDGLPTVTAGDVVDVVAANRDGTGVRVATAARVLAVDGEFLWLGVDQSRVDAVAAAGAAGRVTLAVRPATAASP